MPDPSVARRHARIAVIGAGWWSQGWHLPHLSRNPLAEISAIVEPCDAPRSTLNPDMKTLEELKSTYGVPIFKTFDEFLLSSAAASTDGVVVATSHSSHAEIGLKALGAGFHVFMEKPMTTDPAEASSLARAAAAKDKVFLVNNTANFRDSAQKVREVVASKVGTVKFAQGFMACSLLWLFDNPENEGWVRPTGTMEGNGFGWGQMSHALAWLYYVTELEPTRVYCNMVKSEKTGADIFDTAVIQCLGGAVLNVQGTASLPFKSYASSTKQIDMKIFGSEGVVTYSGEDMHPSSGGLKVQLHDGSEHHVPGFYFENYDSEGDGPESLHAFIHGCLGEQFTNAADVLLGKKVVDTIHAMYRSAQSGHTEPIAAAKA
ncbi:xacA [Symbiodinium sp. CCMP2592]|nr:xacA [Symbiodinium sp. CCMP2592]